MKYRWCLPIIALLLATAPVFAQKKLKLSDGWQRATFRSGDKILVYDPVELEMIEGRIREFLHDSIVLSFDITRLDTLALSDIQAFGEPHKNQGKWTIVPMMVSMIGLYVSPFAGITADGYAVERTAIVAASNLAIGGTTLLIMHRDTHHIFRTCLPKVKVKLK